MVNLRLYLVPLTAVCLDFINENKMIFIKKANSTTMTTSEIFKCYKNSTLSDAQNAGNRIFELLDFKYFLCVCVWVGGGGGEEGACSQAPLEERGLAAHLVVTAAYYIFSGRL